MGKWGCWSLLWPHFSQGLPHSGCTSQWSRVRPLRWPGQSPAQKSSRWSTAAKCCREQCLQPSPPFPSRRTLPRLGREKLQWLLATVPWGEEVNTIKTRLCMLKSPEPGAEDQISFMGFVPRCLKDELSLFLKGFLQAVFRNPAGQSARHPSLREAANGGESRYYVNKTRTKLVTPTGSGDMFSQQSWFSCSQLFLVHGERQRVKFCLTYYRFLVLRLYFLCFS